MKCKLLLMFLVGLLALGVTSCQKNEPKKKIKVLLRMMPLQYDYYVKEVIPAFEKENNCDISVVTFEEGWKIEDILKLEKEKTEDKITVVKVPFEMTRILSKKDYLTTLESIIAPDQFKLDQEQYYPLAMQLGNVDGSTFYFPRKLETRVLVYLKSKVKMAVDNWEPMRDDIDKVLKVENGYGLPKDYILESDPNNWDNFDVFVAGYYWSHTLFNDIQMPRIAHRAKRYEGTALDLVDRAYRMGATAEDIVKIDSSKVLDMFAWEQLYVKAEIYNPGMWQDMWSGSDIYNGFKDGKVFMAEMQQVDCFFLHGWNDNPQMPGYVKDPSDLAFAKIPSGVALNMDKDGKPLYRGAQTNTTGGWWWGIPATADEKELGYKFIQYVTSKKIQAEEISKFGILPVRKDLVFRLPEVFTEGWVGEAFKVSSEQMKLNGSTVVPLIKDYPSLANIYIGLWYDVVIKKYSTDVAPIQVSANEIKKAIDETYKEQLSNIK